MPLGHVPLCEIVEFELVAGFPFTVSLLRTFAIGVPPVDGAVPLSVTGLITGVTVILSTTVKQFAVGVAKSHN